MFKFKIDKEAVELLCKVMKQNGLSEIEVKSGSQSIKLSKSNNQNTIISTFKENQIDKKEESSKDTNSLISNSENTVKAPMLGTLYHSPSPNSKPFIKVGSKVKAGDVIFIIEAMKTMNHIPSPFDGTIREICVEDGQPVEFGQKIAIVD